MMKWQVLALSLKFVAVQNRTDTFDALVGGRRT